MLRNFFYFFRYPILLVIFNFILTFSGFYNLFGWIDIPMHFLGGFLVAHSFILIYDFLNNKKMIKINNKFIFVFLIVSIVGFIAILWECWEFLMVYLFNLPWQGNLADTMGDFVLGLIGAFFMVVFHFDFFKKSI
ncbi:MAG TPA: hypothetical protein HA283_05460 [Nanoarchaeota archaeon]|nr:hypothetical protein [Nanoarchaeota archaeon]HIH63715.1 hypothetical protein [Nanoarchaeota archaeon]HIJ09588.1 hypothetical protein [Nanoarchaeota archaeon]